ncbi:MAG: PepSY domain-containing protein [Clostridiales bacterium]|nr:PepSY domain-containing protein [Clostridiales bacterium]
MTKTLTRTITAALLIAALAVPAAAATTDIGVEKAKEAALSHAGVAESDTVFLIAEADYDDGRKEYEVEFYAGGTEYDYTIDAASGRVLKFDTELEWYSADDDAGYGWQNVIGKQKAQEIALADAGVAAGDALHLIVKPDWDDGVRIYEVEFYTASQEYDYEIHAETGGILSRDREAEWNGTAASGSSNTGSTGSTASASTTDIGEAKARSVALSHAGISESSTSYIYAKKDWDDGRWVYDVEFWADGKEYDYEILASDGTILSYDYDAEYQWSGSTGTSGDTISTEKVKSIVTDRAGVSGTFRELKLERDDGRTVYEGEMRSGRTDYEFTIDAYTGAVLEWDTDWDD